MPQNNLAQRVLSAVVMLLVAAALIALGRYTLWLLVLGIAGVAWWEFVTMGRSAGRRPFMVVGGGATLGICLLAAAPPVWRDLALVGAFGAIALAALVRRDHTDLRVDIGYTIFGLFWIGWLAGYAIYLRDFAGPVSGLTWLLTAIVITIAADTGAYFTGRAFGRHLLAPQVSPKKTVEGLIGGLVAVAIVGGIAAPLALHLPWWQGAGIGLIGGLAAVLGDLLESAVKRRLGVKDSSALIPGHGGVLDRIDSLLFALPAITACVILIQSG